MFSSHNSGEKSRAGPNIHLTAKYTISRFVVAYLGMLTCEHEAIDFSKLVSSGLLGLSQSVIKLAETIPSTENTFYEEVGPNKVPYLRQDTCQDQEEQEGTMSNFQVGTMVVRGPDWKWGDQDGPPPGRGTVISELSSDYWIRVRWDSGAVHSYRMVKDKKYDLMVAPEAKPSGEDSPVDAELTVGMTTPYPAEDMVTSLILQSSVCLLRSMVVAFGVHSHQLSQRTSTLLSNLLYHLMECAKKISKECSLLKLYTVYLLSPRTLHHRFSFPSVVMIPVICPSPIIFSAFSLVASLFPPSTFPPSTFQ